MPSTLRSFFVLTAAVVFGCNVFDESLVPAEDSNQNPAQSLLGEDCVSRDIPTFDSLNEFRQIDLSRLENDRYQLSCVGNARGNDGFFAVEMQKGKKWHFHVKVTPGSSVDPAVYVLDSGCQDSVCQRGWGLNECVAGQDEHFSFVPTRTGTYFVAVDSMTEGGEPMQILAVQPDCGNDVKEHSETCDDGNVVAGDGCDALCRAELSASTSNKEVEPNDEPLANSNVLLLDGGSLAVSGQLGSKCDFDSYAVTVQDGGNVKAKVTPSGSGSCGIALRLQLVDTDGLTPLGTVDADGGACPALDGNEPFASGLSAGTYFVRVTAGRQDEPELFDYSLEIETNAP